MASHRRIIYQAKTVRLILDEKKSDTVFVTFNEIGFGWNEDHYWGETLFAPLPFTVLGFVTPEANWYPPDDMVGALAAANAAIAGRKVITYGHSQGGYGALKFSKALTAVTALAFSPLWSINPADVASFDPRTAQYYRPALRNGHRIENDDLCPRNFVFFDPYQKNDLQNVARICRSPLVHKVIVPFTEHEPIRMVAESKTASLIVTRSLSPELTAAELRGIIRSARRYSETYQKGELKHLLRRAKTGFAFLERYLSNCPDGPFKRIINATKQAQRGNKFTAFKMIRNISDSEWLENDLLELWTMFRDAEFREAELRIAPLLKIKYPNDVFRRLHAVNTYINAARTPRVLEEMELIVKMPGARAHTTTIATYYNLVERPDLLSRFFQNA